MGQSGGDIAYNGGALVGELVASGLGFNVKKASKEAKNIVLDNANAVKPKKVTGGKLVKGSQEAKDRMAAMRTKRRGGSVAVQKEDSEDEVEGGKFRLGRRINKVFSKKNVRKATKAVKKGVVDTYRSKEFKKVADVGTDIGLAYAVSEGHITPEQAKDIRKAKKAAIHEDTEGLKKAVIDGALNEGKRQAGAQLKGGALKEPAVKRKPKGVSNVTMYPNIPKTLKGNGFRPAGRGVSGGGFLY